MRGNRVTARELQGYRQTDWKLCVIGDGCCIARLTIMLHAIASPYSKTAKANVRVFEKENTKPLMTERNGSCRVRCSLTPRIVTTESKAVLCTHVDQHISRPSRAHRTDSTPTQGQSQSSGTCSSQKRKMSQPGTTMLMYWNSQAIACFP